jgi:hypothetical protein
MFDLFVSFARNTARAAINWMRRMPWWATASAAATATALLLVLTVP